MIVPKRKEAKAWGVKDARMLREFYGSMTNDVLATAIGCSAAEVEEEATRLAMRKNKGCLAFRGQPMPRWSVREVEYLREHYADEANLAIALALGRSTKSVVSKASHIGLRKSSERRRDCGKENVAKRYGR